MSMIQDTRPESQNISGMNGAAKSSTCIDQSTPLIDVVQTQRFNQMLAHCTAAAPSAIVPLNHCVAPSRAEWLASK